MCGRLSVCGAQPQTALHRGRSGLEHRPSGSASVCPLAVNWAELCSGKWFGSEVEAGIGLARSTLVWVDGWCSLCSQKCTQALSVLFEECHWDTLVSLSEDPMSSCRPGEEVLAAARTSACWRFAEMCYFHYSVCIQSGLGQADPGDHSPGGHCGTTVHFAFWDLIALYGSRFVDFAKRCDRSCRSTEMRFLPEPADRCLGTR